MDQTRERILERIRLRRALPEPEQRAALRTAAGLSLRDLADAMGVSTTTVFYWETGRRNPNAKHLDAYLTALQTLADDAS
jgi:transcriptional regulator with XRE-family HTH domain